MERILIVDPDSEQRECMALGLKMSNYDVVQASTYDRGLQRLSSAEFDMVLIDVMIPGGRGLQLARDTRARFPEVDVVMTGGYSLSRGQLQRAGLDDGAFVAKPFSIADLSRFIDGRLSRRSDPDAARPAC